MKRKQRRSKALLVLVLCAWALLLAWPPGSFSPAFASSPSAWQPPAGYWRFLEARPVRYEWSSGSAASQNASVAEGQMSITVEFGGDEPSTYATDCSWTWQVPNGLDRLTPGDTIKGHMMVTDHSALFKTYDGYFHGYSGADGYIRIDRPYLSPGIVWENAIDLLNVRAGYQESASQDGELAVPTGPMWDGKMGLKAGCNAGIYERVYEWVPGATPAGPTTGVTPVPGVAGEPPPEPGSGGLGWIVVVGGAVAVGAAGLAAVAAGGILIASKRGSAPKSTVRPGYILQLTTWSLEVRPKQSALLGIQAWRITPQGGTVPAPEAIIQVILPAEPAGLAVAPARGQGKLECIFSAPNPSACARLAVTVTGSAGGVQTSVQVEVRIVPIYELEMGSQDPLNRILPGAEGLWAWARVNATPPDPQSSAEQLTGQIRFEAQGPNSDWIKLQPPVFRDGMQWVQVIVLPPAPGAALRPGNPSLLARCTVAGQPPLEASLKLALNQDMGFEAFVGGQKQADVTFDRTLPTPGWNFPEIVTFFHTPDEPDKVAVPSFKYEFQTPAIRVEPPVLDVEGIYELQAAHNSLRVILKEGIDLEQFFGKDLAGRDGMIEVTVAVRADNGKTYQAAVAYRLRPQIELFAHGWVDPQSHVYKNLSLAGLEFVADGEDRLGVAVACCRTDQSGAREVGRVALIDPAWWTWDWALHGDAMPGFDSLPPQPIPEGGHELTVLPQKPLLYAPQRAAQKLVLHLEAGLAEGAPSNYLRVPLALDLELTPRYPDLRLWVVPGQLRGSSEAWALVFLGGDARSPVEGEQLRVEAAARGAGKLDVSGGETAKTGRTGPDGSLQWVLEYHGLAWSNYDEACFLVNGQIQAPDNQLSEPVTVQVDIAGNVRSLLAEFSAARDMLQLANPNLQGEGVARFIKLTYYRPFLRGPLWNAIGKVTGSDTNANKAFRTWVCSELRDRVATWLCRRRHYHPNQPEQVETMAKMNGIEFEHFSIPPVHVWEAIFLSGMDPMDDPRALDPWWIQKWDPVAEGPSPMAFALHSDHTLDGLLTNREERTNLIETGFWAATGTVAIAAALKDLIIALFPVLGPSAGLSMAAALPYILQYATLAAAALAGDSALLCAGPAFVYDPATGYSFWDSQKGISQRNARWPYISREQFIRDWTEFHPQG